MCRQLLALIRPSVRTRRRRYQRYGWIRSYLATYLFVFSMQHLQPILQMVDHEYPKLFSLYDEKV